MVVTDHAWIDNALAQFAEHEEEMTRNLAHLKEAGPEHAYQTYKRACERMREQNASRRNLLEGWKKRLHG